MMNEPISSIMTVNVQTVTEDQTLQEVLGLLKSKKLQHLPVVNGKKLVGIISSSKLFWLNKPHEEFDKIKVGEVMTRGVAFLEPDDKVGAAAEVLMEHLFHAIPICNSDHELLGIVSSYDLLKYQFTKEYPAN